VTLRNRKSRNINETLLGAPRDVNSLDRNGWTSLMWASNRGSLDVVKELTAAGADINKADDEGFSSLMCASVADQTEVIKYLLRRGALVDAIDDYGRTALSWTVTKGDFDHAAMALISAGANVNQTDKGGFTPLMRAALTKHPRCFRMLITHGADAGTRHPEHAASALEMAAKSCDPTMEELAKAHADQVK